MQDLIEKVLSELRGVWRFRRYVLLTAWVVCIVGWLVVYSLPDRYESHARLNIDTETALRPLLRGIAVDSDLATQLNLVRQVLLGRANMEKVASQVGFDVVAMSPSERDDLLTSISSRIEISLEPPAVRDPRIPNTLYRIAYTDSNQQVALKMVDVLLNSFIERTMGSERSGTASAQRFLQDQLSDYDRRLADAEGRLAEFKKKNVGLVPGDQGDYFSRLQTEIREINRLEGSLNVAQRRKSELQRQLRGEIPFVPPTETARNAPRAGETPQDTAGRIAEAQRRLDELLLRFTDKHPDVVAQRETLTALRERQQAELAAIKRGDVGAAAVAGASSNPVYQSIQLSLNQTDVEIAAIRGELEAHRRTEAGLRRLVDTVPQVEAEYARLTRDYDVTKAQYDELLRRLEQARVSGGAEENGVAAYNIVDPPAVSINPVFPNRPLLLTAVFFAAVALGGAIAYLIHMMQPVFVTARSLGELTGLPVLGAVTRTWVEKQRAEIRGGLMRYSAASGMLMVLFVVAVLMHQPASRFVRGLMG